VITVWRQYIIGELAAAAVIACLVVLVRFMSQQMTETTLGLGLATS
jgi:hypothetical protein